MDLLPTIWWLDLSLDFARIVQMPWCLPASSCLSRPVNIQMHANFNITPAMSSSRPSKWAGSLGYNIIAGMLSLTCTTIHVMQLWFMPKLDPATADCGAQAIESQKAKWNPAPQTNSGISSQQGRWVLWHQHAWSLCLQRGCTQIRVWKVNSFKRLHLAILNIDWLILRR